MTRIVLVRHGQTAWNREARFRGQAEVELDAFGLMQAQATGRYVAARWPCVAVYASPLRRTVQTAEAVASAQGLVAQPMEAAACAGNTRCPSAPHSPMSPTGKRLI